MKFIFSILAILSAIPLSIIAPFYPPLATQRGASPFIIGLILAVHPIGQLIVTAFLGPFMKKKYYFKLIFIALAIQSASLFCFSFTQLIHEKSYFIALSIAARFLNGVGSGIFLLCMSALIPILFEKEIEKTFAIFESAQGAGFAIGPLIGAGLFYLFGYIMMFIIIGMIILIFIPILSYSKNKNEKQLKIIQEINSGKQSLLVEEVNEGEKQKEKSVNRRMNLSQSIQNVRMMSQVQSEKGENLLILFFKYQKSILVISVSLMLLLSNFLFFFIEPFQSIYFMQTYHLTETEASVIMSILAITYIFGSLIASKFVNNKHIIILASFAINGVALLFQGPSQEIFYFLPISIIAVIISQIVIGFFTAFIFALIQPFTYQVIQNIYKIEKDDAANISATFYTIFNALGSLSAPNLSGLMYAWLGFQKQMGYFGLFTLLYSLFGLLVFIKKRKYLQNV